MRIINFVNQIWAPLTSVWMESVLAMVLAVDGNALGDLLATGVYDIQQSLPTFALTAS